MTISLFPYGVKMDVKNRIDELRIKKGWTLSKLANEIGVSDTTVYSWFNEQNYEPSRRTIESVCEIFDISLAEFYAGLDLSDVRGKEAVLLEAFRSVPDERKDQVISIVKSFKK